ncbi:Zinc-regulated transporter 3 [Candida viswanathii]|uniref:Zinc-regulated transporter 3 n=1 Tax=Candida viswanathii TaxID=5486 RepID=A0A367XLT3_9ASCO|nr:Zinc-regulated transporter 3 [Candida viswanathii]
MAFPYHLSQGWVLTICSSLLCILGSCIVTIDDVYYAIFPKFITSKLKLQIRENYRFMNATLALSAGSIIFTSLFRLLPESQKYLFGYSKARSDTWLKFDLIFSYISGILICLSFNLILHVLTSQSVVHCAHGDHETYIGEEHSSGTPDSHPETEQTPLLDNKSVHHRKSIILKLLDRDGAEDGSAGECRGYTSAELCAYLNLDEEPTELHYCEIPTLPQEQFDRIHHDHQHHHHETHHHEEHEHEHTHDHDHQHQHMHGARDNEAEIEHHHQHGHANLQRSTSRTSHHSHYNHSHHHHVNTAHSRLLVIGIQTALAITLHKLPEGFITYVTSETNPELGISIFLSLIVHNFVEGFSICLPLFYSMDNSVRNPKFVAISITSVLGGLSNPIGALFGYLFLMINTDKYDLEKLNYIFGITMAVTSGFLTVVALSMFGSSISFGGNVNSSMTWCIIGIAIIGFSYVLK